MQQLREDLSTAAGTVYVTCSSLQQKFAAYITWLPQTVRCHVEITHLGFEVAQEVNRRISPLNKGQGTPSVWRFVSLPHRHCISRWLNWASRPLLCDAQLRGWDRLHL